MKEEEGKENNSQLSQPHTGLSEREALGVPRHPQILADQ